MSRNDPQYSPLLQGGSDEEGDEEEEGFVATESLQDGAKGAAGLPFPKAYRPHRREPTRRSKPFYAFLAILGVVGAGLLIAVIAGAVRSKLKSETRPHPKVTKKPSNTTDVPSTIEATEGDSTLTSKLATSLPTANHEIEVGKSTDDLKTTTIPASTLHNVNHELHREETTADWQVILNNTGAEASIRTPDIDGDGLPDVLYGMAHGVDLAVANTLDELKGIKEYCEEKNLPYPCIGFLLALRGYDGKELWRVPTRSEVMFLMCDLDLNSDGVKDCIGTGRQSTVQAVDLRQGKTLWYADGSEYPDSFKQTWNVYQATPLPDVDGDNVPDVLVPHGGDPNIDAKNHTRVAGRLIVLSGATGRPLGTYLEMPNDRETYMSTVTYTAMDGSQYILFGSGGETVSGDLMAMTLPDLLEATGQSHTLPFQGKHNWKEIFDDNIMVLYEGKIKGVMVPPVIVDVDNDGVKDIIVSAFEGKVIMLDGSTLFPRWTADFPDMESYSTPAPGYYDDDKYLDFMVHFSVGAWPTYNESTVYIISGKNGSILWEDRRPLYVMSSDLVIRSEEDHKDYFIVKMRGHQTGVGSVMRSEVHGVGVQRNISKRDATSEPENQASCEFLENEYKMDHVTCEKDLSNFREQVYILNRDSAQNLTALHRTSVETFEYEVTQSASGNSCIPINARTGMGKMCSTMVPESRATDAVTDVDNDGILDLINVGVLEGRLRDTRYDYVTMKFTTIISRTTIKGIGTGSSRDNPEFSPLESQPWLQYLGSEKSSVYTRN